MYKFKQKLKPKLTSISILIILGETYNHLYIANPIQGEAISERKYKELCRDKCISTVVDGLLISISLPKDIELTKVST